jgi:hypothetical protein
MKTNPLRLAIYTLLSAVGVVLFILIAHANNAGQRDFIEY